MFKSGNEIETIRGHVVRLCVAMLRNEADAEDCAQLVLVKMLKIEDRPENLLAMASRIARRVVIDHIRKKGRQRDFGIEQNVLETVVQNTDDKTAFEKLEDLYDVMMLSPRDWQIIKMTFQNNMTANEIAEELELTADNVRQIKVRVLSKMREQMEKIED